MSSDLPPPPPPPPPGGAPPPYNPNEPGDYGGVGGYGQTPPAYGGAGAYGQPPAANPYGEAPAPHPSGREPATLGSRFLARLIDGVIFLVVILVIGFVVGLILVSTDTVNLQTGTVEEGGNAAATLVSTLITTALQLGYFAYLESSRGQTVGKMVMKLKVVSPSGGNPTFTQALKRNLWLAAGVLGIVSTGLSSLVSLAAVVLIVIGISRDSVRRQSFFDKFGGDLQVVKAG